MNELVEEYRNILCYFCHLSACLEDVKFRLEKGEEVSEEEVSSFLEHMGIAKRSLLNKKEELGIPDGLDFMDNVNFQGFQFVDGELSGDYKNLEKILLPWVENFDMKNPYKYEVGVLLLSHYMKQTGYEKTAKKKKRTFLGVLKLWLKKRKEKIMYKAEVNYLNESKEVETMKKRFLFKNNAVRWARKMCFMNCGSAFIKKDESTVCTIL